MPTHSSAVAASMWLVQRRQWRLAVLDLALVAVAAPSSPQIRAMACPSRLGSELSDDLLLRRLAS
eukprot:6561793-Prymnesium_polylepis.1